MMKSDLKTGMIVTLRRGVTRIVIGIYLFDEQGDVTGTLNCYNNDLTHMNNCKSEDIMKIIHGGEIIWERVEWDKVPFGTKVRVWDCNDEEQIGRFLMYDKENEDDEFPFLVFVKSDKSKRYTDWYKYCEIIEEV